MHFFVIRNRKASYMEKSAEWSAKPWALNNQTNWKLFGRALHNTNRTFPKLMLILSQTERRKNQRGTLNECSRANESANVKLVRRRRKEWVRGKSAYRIWIESGTDRRYRQWSAFVELTRNSYDFARFGKPPHYTANGRHSLREAGHNSQISPADVIFFYMSLLRCDNNNNVHKYEKKSI